MSPRGTFLGQRGSRAEGKETVPRNRDGRTRTHEHREYTYARDTRSLDQRINTPQELCRGRMRLGQHRIDHVTNDVYRERLTQSDWYSPKETIQRAHDDLRKHAKGRVALGPEPAHHQKEREPLATTPRLLAKKPQSDLWPIGVVGTPALGTSKSFCSSCLDQFSGYGR